MEKKYVTYKNLKVGQKIEGTKDGTMTSGFIGYVKSINPSFVTISMWTEKGEEKQISTDCMFSVEMTEKEFRRKYEADVLVILESLKNELADYEIGYHEMWNSWFQTDLYETASACAKEKIKIIGICKDIIPKHAMFTGELLDIGIVAEYEDGEKFWCHFSQEMLDKVIRRYYKRKEYEVRNTNVEVQS